MTPIMGLAWLVAGLTALLAPAFLKRLLARWGVVDTPNFRSSHAHVTLRGGGLAQLLGIVAGSTVAWLGSHAEARSVLVVVVVGSSLVGVLGFVEDMRGLPIGVRAGSQLALGVGISLWFAKVGDLSWVWVGIFALGFAAYVNFANFMDGINGISSIHGAAVGALFAVIGVVGDLDSLIVLGGVVSMAFLAFLPWNLLPPGIFLGDVGSYLLGGSISALAMVALISGTPVIAVFATLSIYLADAVTTLLRRIINGERWFEPHRQHVYQRLVDSRTSHTVVALFVGVLTLAAGGIGIAAGTVSDLLAQVLAWTGIAALCLFYLVSPRLLSVRKGRVGIK